MINHLFAAGPAPVSPVDVNRDSTLNAADVFRLIQFLFAGGTAPSC